MHYFGASRADLWVSSCHFCFQIRLVSIVARDRVPAAVLWIRVWTHTYIIYKFISCNFSIPDQTRVGHGPGPGLPGHGPSHMAGRIVLTDWDPLVRIPWSRSPERLHADLAPPRQCFFSFTAEFRLKSFSTLGRPSRKSIYDMGGLTEADWIRRFQIRCERIADVLNRPQLRHLRTHDLVPWPPYVYTPIGSRRWRNLFCAWRDLCYAMARAMAEEHGFEFED